MDDRRAVSGPAEAAGLQRIIHVNCGTVRVVKGRL